MEMTYKQYILLAEGKVIIQSCKLLVDCYRLLVLPDRVDNADLYNVVREEEHDVLYQQRMPT
jgi:hypothetical protein